MRSAGQARAGRQRPARRGFTLIELMLVIVIIGVLAGMVVVNLSGRAQEARTAAARSDLANNLRMALDIFEQDVGRYPTDQEGLAALVEDPGVPGWKGPYVQGGLKPDPWQTPYAYSQDPEHPNRVLLRSAGPDRQLGTDDDITG